MKSVAEKLAEVLKASKDAGLAVEDLPAGISVGDQFWGIWDFFGSDDEFASYKEILKFLHVPLHAISYGKMQEIFVDLLNERTQLERWLKLESFK